MHPTYAPGCHSMIWKGASQGVCRAQRALLLPRISYLEAFMMEVRENRPSPSDLQFKCENFCQRLS